jgi:hypothetical protein
MAILFAVKDSSGRSATVRSASPGFTRWPTVSILASIAFLAEAGYHTLVIDNGDAGDSVSSGAIILAGIGGAL